MKREGGDADTQALPSETTPAPSPADPTVLEAGAPAAVAMDRTSDQPAWLGRFIVFEEIGAGGMGRVFAAYDPELDRKVALKLVQSPPGGAGNGDWQARLIREAQAMAKLSHPNVVTVFEVSAHAGQVFVAMELVKGRDLARWLLTPRSWQSILEVFRAAGEGLAAAHGAGLVHRDFKPSNVLVGDDGRVRVADFGLVHTRTARALALRDSDSHISDVFARELTHFGAMMGTPAYMSPEQISGESTDPRSDLFSFCVALWEALYGLRPFGGETMPDRLAAIRRGELRDPGPSTVPRWLRPLLLRGLSDEPADRWPSMRSLLDALARDPERERARRRRTALLIVSILTLGGALVYGASALWSHFRAQARENAALLHLDTTLARLSSLRDAGREVAADAVLDAFVADPEHTGTRGLTPTTTHHDPWADARRALTAGEHAQALAALDAAERDVTPPQDLPFWRALALLGTDRGPEAVRLLADTLDLRATASPQYRLAVALLAVHGATVAPAFRAALGPGYLQLFIDTWGTEIGTGRIDAPLMRAFLEHHLELDNLREADMPGLGDPLELTLNAMYLARAAIYAQLQDSDRAHREHEVVDLTAAAATPTIRPLLATTLHRLAVLDLADDRIDHAFMHLTAARALYAPEIFADMMRAAPELTPLHSDPRWPALLDD